MFSDSIIPVLRLHIVKDAKMFDAKTFVQKLTL